MQEEEGAEEGLLGGPKEFGVAGVRGERWLSVIESSESLLDEPPPPFEG